jgi:hypothetical protein
MEIAFSFTRPRVFAMSLESSKAIKNDHPVWCMEIKHKMLASFFA